MAPRNHNVRLAAQTEDFIEDRSGQEVEEAAFFMSLSRKERHLRLLRRWYQVYNYLRCAAFFIRMKDLTQITRRDMTEQFGIKNMLLIEPNGRFKLGWNFVVLLFISFTVVWMPFYMAYFG